MDLKLDGRLSLVSGSTAGIGYAIAEALAAEGARVIINGRQQASVDKAIASLRKVVKADVLGFAGDLADASVAEALVRAHPGIEILVNNLGIYGRKAAFELVATGEAIDAERAVVLGMFNAVHDDDRLMDEVMALAGRLAAVSRAAMATTKRTFHEVVDLPLARGLEVGREANKRMRSFVRTGQ